MSGRSDKTVCVTGASGYIASWLVKLLLLRGYTVKATVRDPDDKRKTEHLRALDGAEERLRLVRANLLDEGSFDAAVEGCLGVFHTATTVILTTNRPSAEIIDPAVKGTLNVLKSCRKFPSVKRVVITSSMASVMHTRKSPTADDTVDETWVSDPAVCEDTKIPYVLAKTLAEDAAWKFAKAEGIDLVTLHPGLVSGPTLQSNLNFSTEVILRLLQGQNLLGSNLYRFIDVQDVALAHIRAFEHPSANGRYCLDGIPITLDELEKILSEFQPTLYIPRVEGRASFPLDYKASREKATTLGICDLTPPEVSLREMVRSLHEKGLYRIGEPNFVQSNTFID